MISAYPPPTSHYAALIAFFQGLQREQSGQMALLVGVQNQAFSDHDISSARFTAAAGGTRITYTADISFLGLIGYAELYMGRMLAGVGKNAIRGLQAALSADPPPPFAKPVDQPAGSFDSAGNAGVH